jgi:hypothetical protein
VVSFCQVLGQVTANGGWCAQRLSSTSETVSSLVERSWQGSWVLVLYERQAYLEVARAVAVMLQPSHFTGQLCSGASLLLCWSFRYLVSLQVAAGSGCAACCLQLKS